MGGGALERLGEVVGEAAGEAEARLPGRVAVCDGRLPADLDPREEVGLRARHAVEARGTQAQVAEDLGVGVKGDSGAAAVRRRALVAERSGRQAAGEVLHVESAVARHLDAEPVGEGIDHADADAVEAARRLVGLASELAARVERAEDDLERRLGRKLRVRVDRDAAAVVANGDRIVVVELHLDAGGVARHRLVHGVVEHLGHEVVQRPLVGAADIHARALADGLQPFQHLDGRCVVGGLGSGEEVVCQGTARFWLIDGEDGRRVRFMQR